MALCPNCRQLSAVGVSRAIATPRLPWLQAWTVIPFDPVCRIEKQCIRLAVDVPTGLLWMAAWICRRVPAWVPGSATIAALICPSCPGGPGARARPPPFALILARLIIRGSVAVSDVSARSVDPILKWAGEKCMLMA